MAHLALGAIRRAEADAIRAERMFTAAGQELEAVHALHNRGLVAYRRGDIPTALQLLEVAASRYSELELIPVDLAIDRCEVFLVAGLLDEATELAESTLRTTIQPSKRAELLFVLATTALAAGKHDLATASARQAASLFHAQQRDRWQTRAVYIATQARYDAGRRDAGLFQQARRVAQRLAEFKAEETAPAQLLAGQLAAHRRDVSADAYLANAARHRQQGSALDRASGWLAKALRHRLNGNSRGVMSSCAKGLDALDEHRLSFGSAELRALATSHGRALATIAIQEAARRADTRSLFMWSERWRATALMTPPVHAPDDGAFSGELAALRDAIRRVEEAQDAGRPTLTLQRERDRRERSIRDRLHQFAGSGGAVETLNFAALCDELGSTTLVELIEVDGSLHAIVVHGRRATRYHVGPIESALETAGYARFTLRRIARGRVGSLAETGARLQTALLGASVDRLSDGPIVIVPPGRLQVAPWGLLPMFAERPVSVSPSARFWLRARRQRAPERRTTTLIAGPELGTGGAEIYPLAEANPEAVLLEGDSATVDRVIAALDGAWLAHIAAHGKFRRDSPMFSSLRVHDGPLTVYDLERLRRPPYRVILSACDSGVGAPVGADEVLGFGTTLLSLGAAGVIVSVNVVDDAATAAVMGYLHEALHHGADLATALLHARQASRDNQVVAATAASFVAMGV